MNNRNIWQVKLTYDIHNTLKNIYTDIKVKKFSKIVEGLGLTAFQ